MAGHGHFCAVKYPILEVRHGVGCPRARINRMEFQLDHTLDPYAVRRILETLPDWFGDRDAIEQHVADAAKEDFLSLVVHESGVTTGVALVRRHFLESDELHLIATSPEVRGQGERRALVNGVAAQLAEDGCVQLSVHTVGPSFESDIRPDSGVLPGDGLLSPENAPQTRTGQDRTGPTLILVRRLVPAS